MRSLPKNNGVLLICKCDCILSCCRRMGKCSPQCKNDNSKNKRKLKLKKGLSGQDFVLFIFPLFFNIKVKIIIDPSQGMYMVPD